MSIISVFIDSFIPTKNSNIYGYNKYNIKVQTTNIKYPYKKCIYKYIHFTYNNDKDNIFEKM